MVFSKIEEDENNPNDLESDDETELTDDILDEVESEEDEHMEGFGLLDSSEYEKDDEEKDENEDEEDNESLEDDVEDVDFDSFDDIDDM